MILVAMDVTSKNPTIPPTIPGSIPPNGSAGGSGSSRTPGAGTRPEGATAGSAAPTSGVDVSTRHDVLHLLGDLHEDGVAIVLTTHDLNGMAAHLPHIVCVNGRIIADGTPAQVITPPVLERTFGARMEVLEHLGMRVVVDEAPSLKVVRGGE